MLSSKTLRLAGLALVSGLFVPAAFTVACSSDNASNPVPTVPTYAVDATTSPPARLPATGAPASDAGCWNAADPNCRAQTNPEFLNQCAGTGVTCARFD